MRRVNWKIGKIYYTAALKSKAIAIALALALALALLYKSRSRSGNSHSSSTAALLLRRPQLPAERLPKHRRKHRRSSCLYATIEALLCDPLFAKIILSKLPTKGKFIIFGKKSITILRVAQLWAQSHIWTNLHVQLLWNRHLITTTTWKATCFKSISVKMIRNMFYADFCI